MRIGPEIITNGLVLYLDAANPKSYRGEAFTNVWTSSEGVGGSGLLSNATIVPNTWGIGLEYMIVLNNQNNRTTSQYMGTMNIPSGQTYTLVFYARNRDNSPIVLNVANSPANSVSPEINNNVTNSATHLSATHIGGGIYFCKMVVVSGSLYPVNGIRKRNLQNPVPTEISGIMMIAGDWGHLTPRSYLKTVGSTSTRGTSVSSGGGLKNLISDNNEGVIVGGVKYYGDNPSSLYFDGVDDYVLFSESTLDYSAISGWIRTTTISEQYIVSGFMISDSTIRGCIGIQSGYLVWSRGTPRRYTSKLVNDGFWHQFHLNKVTVSDYVMYIDGELSTYDAVVSTSGRSEKSIIGARAYQSAYSLFFDGSISNIIGYNRILTLEEITKNYNSTKSRYK